MTDQIYVYPKVYRQLSGMERQHHTPAIAAQRARRIIRALIRGETPAKNGLLCPRRDNRLENCLKFNLGSGFRLICIKDRKRIYVMFAGDHGNCDAWLDNYRKKNPHKKPGMERFPVKDPGRPRPIPPQPPGICSEKDDFGRISQKDLRHVFRGLVGSS